MRGTVAKRIRKQVKGDMLVAHSREPFRRVYRKAKRLYTAEKSAPC